MDPIRLASAALQPFHGRAWRQQAPTYDPRSGEGARLHGGRFNPPQNFPVLYLCTTRPCALAELRRLAEREAMPVANLLPRHLWRYELDHERCLNLIDKDIFRQIGIDTEVLVEPSWELTQQIGTAAHAVGVQAIQSPSATGVDTVIAVFLQNLGVSSLTAGLDEEWTDADTL